MHLMCTIINGVDIFRADIARIEAIVYYNLGKYKWKRGYAVQFRYLYIWGGGGSVLKLFNLGVVPFRM